MTGCIHEDVTGFFFRKSDNVGKRFLKNPVTSANFFENVRQPCPVFSGKTGKSFLVF
jgi:hypothetical protein